MKVNPITTNQNFEGKVILKNKISTQQNHLFNLHKSNLEKMIADMPFDLFVEQSKSKKTITLSTNVENAYSYIVKKNKQDFEEAASYAISDAKKKSKAYQIQEKGREIFEVIKLYLLKIFEGNFKEARQYQKQLAKMAINDFEIYKGVSNFKLTDFPNDVNKILLKNSLKYKIYDLFSMKTKEEKQLRKMNKEYYKELKAKNIENKPQIISYRKLLGLDTRF